MDRVGRVRWMVRQKSRHPVDSGWRIMGLLDNEEYLADTNNWEFADFNDVCLREPALIGIWDFPVGSDLEIVDEGKIQIVDTPTGQFWCGSSAGMFATDGRYCKTIEWKPGQPRDGIWDMGHFPKREYYRLRDQYLNHEFSPRSDQE